MNAKKLFGRIALSFGTALIHAGGEAIIGKAPSTAALVEAVEGWLEKELKTATAEGTGTVG